MLLLLGCQWFSNSFDHSAVDMQFISPSVSTKTVIVECLRQKVRSGNNQTVGGDSERLEREKQTKSCESRFGLAVLKQGHFIFEAVHLDSKKKIAKSVDVLTVL